MCESVGYSLQKPQLKKVIAKSSSSLVAESEKSFYLKAPTPNNKVYKWFYCLPMMMLMMERKFQTCIRMNNLPKSSICQTFRRSLFSSSQCKYVSRLSKYRNSFDEIVQPVGFCKRAHQEIQKGYLFAIPC